MYIVHFGYVTKGALVPLSKLCDIVDFAEDLQDMLAWLDECSNGFDGAFTRSLRQRLWDQARILDYKFTSSYGVKISLKSAVLLSHEKWIDDSVIDAIVKTILRKYGHRGTYLFVPTQTLNEWIRSIKDFDGSLIPWNSHQSTVLAMADEGKRAREANEDKEVKVFAVADLGGHWGALCADFTEEKILSGHSLDKGILSERTVALFALKTWLRFCGSPVDDWQIERLDVPQQDSGSGSCGINACNAIERHFDPTVERWTGERSRHHRIRFLRLLTESAEVRST